MLRSLAPLALSLLLMACGAAGPSAPAKAPETTRAPSQAPKAGETAAKSSNPLAELPPGIPEASADCPARTKVARAACAARGDFTVELAKALSSSGVEQDRLLGCLESAPEAPPGLLRALRADLAPRGCGDATVGDGVVS